MTSWRVLSYRSTYQDLVMLVSLQCWFPFDFYVVVDL